MSRERARHAAPEHHAQLPAAYWTRLEDVRLPGTREPIDLVLVGPSGVHVVLDDPALPQASTAVPRARTGPEDVARRAADAAAGVALLLPLRYRHTVLPELRLLRSSEVAVDVGAVLVGSPDVLWQAWRHRARVLSTSEVVVVGGLLARSLEPNVEATAPKASRWRRTRPWLVGAATLAGAAAVTMGWVPDGWVAGR